MCTSAAILCFYYLQIILWWVHSSLMYSHSHTFSHILTSDNFAYSLIFHIFLYSYSFRFSQILSDSLIIILWWVHCSFMYSHSHTFSHILTSDNFAYSLILSYFLIFFQILSDSHRFSYILFVNNTNKKRL